MADPVYTEERTPYEFLGRWNDGVLTGAHVGFRTKTLKDGVVIADILEPVMRVDVGLGDGFPLEEILAQLQIDALVMCDEKQDALDAKNAELTTKTEAHAEAVSMCDAKDAEIAAKNALIVAKDAQIAELQAAAQEE